MTHSVKRLTLDFPWHSPASLFPSTVPATAPAISILLPANHQDWLTFPLNALNITVLFCFMLPPPLEVPEVQSWVSQLSSILCKVPPNASDNSCSPFFSGAHRLSTAAKFHSFMLWLRCSLASLKNGLAISLAFWGTTNGWTFFSHCISHLYLFDNLTMY